MGWTSLRRASVAVAAVLGLSACGTSGGAPAATQSAGSSTAAAAAVTLATGASSLCKTAPTNQALVATLNTDSPPAVADATGLTPVGFGQPGQDGPFTAATIGGRAAVQVAPGQDSSGTSYTYEELYFTSGGVLPASAKNVLLCLEYYDSPSGVDLEAQYSGNDAVGPINGAYNGAPEAYLTGGSTKWLVASFTFSNVNFLGGASGSGLENGGADFRVTSSQTAAWATDKAWLVISGVTAATPLPNAPAPPTTPSTPK